MLKLLFGVSLATVMLACGGGDKAKSTASAKQSAAPTTSAKPGAAPTGGAAGEIDPACTAFEDRTDENADRTVAWDATLATSAERCIKIKVGQAIRWEGDFAKYPMSAAKGDSPTPITNPKDLVSNPGAPGEEFTAIAFEKAGTFGFSSTPDSKIKGAVQVVP
ncbi:MAG: hypothetical protein HOW73_08970 [Polyangiaceae bacterium]|nr:hypothetical protein [Polyangiaceae bacterium]